jgi:hypothetical protein
MVYRDWDVTVSDEREPVGELQLRMPARFTLHLRDNDDGGPDVDITWQVRNGVPECTQVNITATEKGHEVRVSGLAGIRLEDCLEFALKSMLFDRTDGSDEPQLPDKTHWFDLALGREAVKQTRTVRAARKVKITDAFLREVAKVYRENISDRPTQAVAEYFGKQHRTAAYYVHEARERKILRPTTKGKAGEQVGEK